MPKIVCVSDTHNQLDKVTIPDCDILVIAGDVTSRGDIPEISRFNQDLVRLRENTKNIVMICGNHDFCFERDPHLTKTILTNVDYYLENSSAEIMGLKFYGSPITPRFYDWAFNADSPKLRETWGSIPAGIDILITHGPPKGILDLTSRGISAGCEILAEQIFSRIKPKYHIFGHIHEGYGQVKNGDTTFINASTCDLKYRPINPPIVFDI